MLKYNCLYFPLKINKNKTLTFLSLKKSYICTFKAKIAHRFRFSFVFESPAVSYTKLVRKFFMNSYFQKLSGCDTGRKTLDAAFSFKLFIVTAKSNISFFSPFTNYAYINSSQVC